LLAFFSGQDVLDLAGVKALAVQVRFNGLDEPVVTEAPDFMKSLDIDHAHDGEVMVAFAMNDEQLPLLNGGDLGGRSPKDDQHL
jgi:DMSO/TMAO reductase YedYZ molybdopterin-dependent catalytic subunit